MARVKTEAQPVSTANGPERPSLTSNAGQRMNPSLPNAESARSTEERAKIKRVIAERGLWGLANDTKWDEFVAAMRERESARDEEMRVHGDSSEANRRSAGQTTHAHEGEAFAVRAAEAPRWRRIHF